MEGQYNNKDAGTVILMLDNKCLPPCYCFETDSHEVRSISPEILDEVLEWVSQFKPSPPSMLYMVGAPQELDIEVQKVLEDVASSVICAPMQTAEQEKAGLPFSNTQMVVFPSLVDFERDNGIARGRSCVVHIGCEEISRWSEVLKAQATEIDVSRMRFRPRNLHQWDRSHLKAYRYQFIKLRVLKYRLYRAGVSVGWELRSFSRCPAMRTLVTIGPDGLCYPCPTFYYAGQTNGLGAFKTLTSDRVFLQNSKQTCRLCQSEYCEACLFWESGHVTGEVTTCELPTGIDRDTSWEEIIRDKDRSGYSWLKIIFMKMKNIWSLRYRRLKNTFIMKKKKWALRPSNTRSLYYRLIRSKFVLTMIKPPASFRKSPLILHSSQLESCVRNGLPEIHEYKNVLFVPGLKAVYYDNGELIQSSTSKGGLSQNLKQPSFIDIQQVKHSVAIDKALFGGRIFPHFGHFLLESLSRLWPLVVSDMEKEVFECDILYWTSNLSTGAIQYKVSQQALVILESLNIKPNIRILNQPVLIHKLIIPKQAVILDSEIYPIFRTLLKTAGDRIIRMYRQSRKDEYKDKVYLSRSNLPLAKRNCVNEKKLENILKDHGFGIFHTQEMSIADQIGLLNSAKIIVGTEGSAFHTMLLSEISGKTILCLTYGEPERTYIGIDRICEVDTKYIRCMYPHPLCMKPRSIKDTIIDIPKACKGIMQYI